MSSKSSTVKSTNSKTPCRNGIFAVMLQPPGCPGFTIPLSANGGVGTNSRPRSRQPRPPCRPGAPGPPLPQGDIAARGHDELTVSEKAILTCKRAHTLIFCFALNVKRLTFAQEAPDGFRWFGRWFAALPPVIPYEQLPAPLLYQSVYSFLPGCHNIPPTTSPKRVNLAAKLNSTTPPGPLRDLAI